MVERSNTGGGPCDYRFEEITVNRKVYANPNFEENKNSGPT